MNIFKRLYVVFLAPRCKVSYRTMWKHSPKILKDVEDSLIRWGCQIKYASFADWRGAVDWVLSGFAQRQANLNCKIHEDCGGEKMKSNAELVDLFKKTIQEQADFHDDWLTGVGDVVDALNFCLKIRFNSDIVLMNKTALLESIRKLKNI